MQFVLFERSLRPFGKTVCSLRRRGVFRLGIIRSCTGRGQGYEPLEVHRERRLLANLRWAGEPGENR